MFDLTCGASVSATAAATAPPNHESSPRSFRYAIRIDRVLEELAADGFSVEALAQASGMSIRMVRDVIGHGRCSTSTARRLTRGLAVLTSEVYRKGDIVVEDVVAEA